MDDVVIHGRVDLRAVAEDLLIATLDELRPVRKSWAAWFVLRTVAERESYRLDQERRNLASRLGNASGAAEAALVRLRLRGSVRKGLQLEPEQSSANGTTDAAS
jgi:hypothetical protein